MAKKTQKDNLDELIKRIEQERDSNVIIYSTGSKKPLQQFATNVANDVLDNFKTILKSFDKSKKVSLLLNTLGGNLDTPWPLVNLIREYSSSLEVIVIKEALSAGTLIALGSSKIVMLPFSHLSPVDPATNHNNKNLEIEDIIGFINFAKDKVGISEQNALAEIVKELTKEVNPTMLGSANRTHALIRKLAKQLLDLNKNLSEMAQKEVVQNLTQDLYFHGHRINRQEAKDSIGFGEMIEYAPESLEKNCELILEKIEDILELNKDFDLRELLDNKKEADYNLTRAVIYSKNIKFNFESEYKIFAMPDAAGNLQYQLTELSSKWRQK